MKIINLPKINPVRDWKIIISIFAVILIGLSLLAWKVYLSHQIGGGYLSQDVLSTNPIVKTFSQKKIQDDILLMESRQADYEKARVTDPRLIDPSL